MQAHTLRQEARKRPRHSNEATLSTSAAVPKEKHQKARSEKDVGNQQLKKGQLPATKLPPAGAIVQVQKSPAVPSTPTGDCRSALLVIGTYHSVMAGLLYRRRKFGLLFSIKRHVGCINAVAAGGGTKYMASAGTDERVFLFTNKSHSLQKEQQKRLKVLQKKRQKQLMKKLKDHNTNEGSEGEVQQGTPWADAPVATAGSNGGEPLALRLTDLGHVAPPTEVRCMKITSNSQLMLCGCNDGQLITYRTRDWSIDSAIPLHEKCISSIALHPGSVSGVGTGAALAVTCSSDDRHVVVVDLLRGRLLSKWRYSTSLTRAVSENSDITDDDAVEANADKKGESDRRRKSSKPARWERHDEPREVLFSPTGSYFAVLSSHALLVYETKTMQAAAYYRASSPLQPHEEMHVFCFLDENTIMIGDENGNIRCCCGPWQGRCTPVVVERRAPSETEGGQLARHPTQHSTRVKALHCAERTLFSMDAAGVAIAWSVEEEGSNGGSCDDNAHNLVLRYICSANCKGRVTTMDLLKL